VHQRLLDERPDIAKRFLGTLTKAADWAENHPDDLKRILAAETGSGPTGVSAAYQFRNLHADLSDERLNLLAEQEHFLRTHGFFDRPVDVREWAIDIGEI
jgi:ABC-type nitrate/sulfonate/bicarbonate transport system substrate-binding protein